MKKILLPHQYYYPHMDLLKNKSNSIKEKDFFNDLDNLPLKKKDAMIYIHIPFCDSKCAFCGFDKVYDLNEIAKYVDILKKEIDFYCNKKYVQELNIIGVHFGGGTPTILPKQILGDLIDTIKSRFNLSNDFVLNIEGSATTLYKDEIIELIKEKNVSRVSIGVQTFNEKLRNEYKTKATLEEVYLTLSKLKENGIMKYIDIMYGYPDFNIGNPKEIVESDIKKAIELDVEGIDFGQIVPFYNQLEKRIESEKLKFSTTDEVVEIIKESTKLMEDAGYTQETCYGFTKGGKIIVETSYYGGEEDMPDCIALGSSAFGLLNGYKYRNVSYNSYLNINNPKFSQIKQLNDFELERMHIVGFPKLLKMQKSRLSKEVAAEYKNKFDYLKRQGLIEESEFQYNLTEKGKCFVDNIYYYLIDDDEKKLIENQIKILTLE